MNPLLELHVLGQSIWVDNISRPMLRSGELKRLVEEDGITGVTSNPTIFEKAIGHGSDYDDTMRELVADDRNDQEIVDALIVQDIQAATDVLRPVFDRTQGGDGYVSIEVPPALAHDTEATIQEARRLHGLVNRPNLFVKVPATHESIPAIRQLLAEGININITLMFSMDHYEAVAQAYLEALEDRIQQGLPVQDLASVASFFVSRVDTLVDGLLEKKMKEEGPEAEKAANLRGKAGIANSKLVYERFKELFGSERFRELAERGARVQRVLWASTSTKNPAYSDVMYVEALIGPDTINTLPNETIAAFKDHGHARLTVEEGVDEAQATFEQLASLGIDMNQVGEQLSVEGVEKFTQSFDKLYAAIGAKRQALAGEQVDSQELALGEFQDHVDETLEQMGREDVSMRLWAKDASLWKSDPERQQLIADRLGWLTIPQTMLDKAGEIIQFADEIRREGFRHVVLLGMGGSSLAPEVYRDVFASRGPVQPSSVDGNAAPELIVLDSTDPTTILAVTRRIDPMHTLFLVSSKSGTTTESQSFYQYFYEKVQAKAGDQAGRNFVAITDSGTPLEKMAHEASFRRVWLAPEDVGGRFSALTYFGLVPAALIGVDIKALLQRALQMARACGSEVKPVDNPAIRLGTALGELAKGGRDKVSFIASPSLASFGYWVEQLIAESTGKEGKGILPIEGEQLKVSNEQLSEVFGRDRVFVQLQLKGEDAQGRKIEALEKAGYSVVRIDVVDKLNLGQEFLRWEIATAVAGMMLGIDPFDQPNVAESKDNTKRLLGELASKGKWSERGAIPPAIKKNEQVDTLTRLLTRVKPGDYIALQAYVPRTPANDRLLAAVRQELRDGLGVPVTVGYGPRFLHSTGQLHKGGANNGVFIQITADSPRDVPIPGEPYTFGTLIRAQASGDLQALKSHKRRAARMHLGDDVSGGLKQLQESVHKAVSAVNKARTQRQRARR